MATFYICCHGQQKCSDLDLKDCENKDCTNKAEKRVIMCYYTNWSWYRKGIGKFTPENIDASLCTHIKYAFAVLDSATLTIKAHDPWADIDNKFFQRVVDLRSKDVEVLLSIGGWVNSAPGSGWSRMLSSADTRKKFIKSVIVFIERYNFSGVDIDYEFAGCPQGSRSASSQADAENFNNLISELKGEFNGKFHLSVTIPAGKDNLKECYNIPQLCLIPDWINVMTYVYHSSAEGVVGANAPMCGTDSSWGVFDTLTYLTSVAKCPSKQLVLGIPFYGASYTLADTSRLEFGVQASGPGRAGEYSENPGQLAYYEICLNQKNGWNTGFSKSDGSYAWSGAQLVSYDSEIDIKRKSCLINKHFNLKEALIWTLDFDDFTDACGNGTYPLLKTLNRQLRCL